MRRDRPSLTASLVAAVRAFYTALPEPWCVAPDPLAGGLAPGWLTLPARIAARYPAAAPGLRRATDVATFGLARNVALRTRAIDDALRAALDRGAAQLVLLGAGLDARAERLAELDGVRIFEVDHPSTHRYKRARLERLPGRRRDVARVAIDFERDRLDEVLLRAGLDRAAPTFWIWEGVTVYLTPEAIAGTLRTVAALSAKGSRLAVTYTRPGVGRGHPVLEPLAHAAAALVGEPLRGMMPSERLAQLLDDAGFDAVSDESSVEWAARHWPVEGRAGGEWERLMVAERRG